MTNRLQKAVEELYSIFSKYGARLEIPGSPLYCDLQVWNRELNSKALQELTSEDLSRFSTKLLTTWGEVGDLKHFLPRILELMAQWDSPAYDIWVFFDRLEMAKLTEWPSEERECIWEFMRRLWESILDDNSEKAETNFQEYFGALAHFYPNFSHLLDAWERADSHSSIKHLANYVFDENQFLFVKGVLHGFKKESKNVPQFKEWLLSERTLNKLEKAYYLYEKEPIAETISWAEKILRDEKRGQF